MNGLLDFDEQALDDIGQVGESGADFPFPAGAVATRENGGLLGDVFRTQFDTEGHTAHLPVVEFPAGTGTFALIESYAKAGLGQLQFQIARHGHHAGFFFVGLADRNNDHLIRSQLGGQH